MAYSIRLTIQSTLLLLVLIIGISIVASAQKRQAPAYTQKIDSLVAAQGDASFNGVILIKRNRRIIYRKVQGVSSYEQATPLKLNSPFLLGSMSKQITAVLVLREVDKGRLDLNKPIKYYLPELQQSWADSITLHQLLNHSSGLVALDKPLAFTPGTRFLYSPYLAYHLLSRVIETTSGKSFDALIEDLFRLARMKNSAYPFGTTDKNQASGYLKGADGQPEKVDMDYKTIRPMVPGGALISTPLDLLRWNDQLHGGKLLSAQSYELMISHQITREHSIWGTTGYGYGIQVNRDNGITELGHSGYCEGFNNINFYYPDSKTSLIILSNTDWYPEDISKTFELHKQIRAIFRGHISSRRFSQKQ
jgi:D-alanyl-D-alanine carboxypeptidase